MANFNIQQLATTAVEQQSPTIYRVQALFATSSTWKNIGYYVAGATYEVWESQDVPNPSPPSGHSLINIHSFKEVG